MKCVYCFLPDAKLYKINKCFSSLERDEEYNICYICAFSTNMTLNYFTHYSACGGCTLSPAFPWVETLKNLNIKNDKPLTIYRTMPKEFIKFDKKIYIFCPWYNPWSKSIDYIKATNYDNVIVKMDLEPFDDRVIYDTTRSIYPCNNTHEEMIIIIDGILEVQLF